MEVNELSFHEHFDVVFSHAALHWIRDHGILSFFEWRVPVKPKESDWKRFRNSLDKWRERYLKRKNDEIRAILEDSHRNETEKFWDIFDFQKKESKILRNCLDGYSRSNMTLHMALMKRYEMIYKEDLDEFSGELQEVLKEIERF